MIGPLIAAFATGEIGLTVERTKRAVLAYVVALVFVLLGVSFLLVAGYIQLARMFGPLVAALGLGIGFVVIGGIVLVVHQSRARTEQRRVAEKRKTDLVSLGATAAIAALPNMMRGRRGRATGAAAAVTPLVLGVAYALYQRRRNADDPGA
ncbi:hypothetical protein [Tianweitania sp.]|uniref:hypothetical protein n=1 Tax=Tianweitania sp. TaxID=2021634 RepID=UPI00289C6266|nr:hypothetical protein [Tianweitania sp.]